MKIKENSKVCILGLGYVGLPLLLELSKEYNTIGYDINKIRIGELKKGFDRTNEVKESKLLNKIKFTYNLKEIEDSDIYIITVPTPINKSKQPDLGSLKKASALVGKFLKKDNVVIYESTVYPGCTKEVCIPILENKSKLKLNRDFYCGYSPERINPGDRKHTLTKIKKITSGSSPEALEIVDSLYKRIIVAGTYPVSSIEIAEAAKVIENIQRDLNIAFVNELSLMFDKLGLNTNEVLEAAGTKWNFFPFKPGLVGGHCIGVDPYYLTYKSEMAGYKPEMILSGRIVNDKMGKYVANRTIKLMNKQSLIINKSKVLILGFSFKENCPDVRNTKVIDVISELKNFGCVIDVVDPLADQSVALKEYKIQIKKEIKSKKQYDAVVVCVSHKEFENIDFENICHSKSVVFDVKSMIKNKNLNIEYL